VTRRVGLVVGIALAAVPRFAAADPSPPSPGVVDCLWSGTPQSFQRSLSGTVDADHFDALVDAYTPTDQQLVALADRCHVAGAPDEPGYQIAALAIMSKARLAWAQARLTTVYKLTPAQLEDAWKLVPPADRAVISRFMQTLDPDLFNQLNAPLVAFTAALHASSDPDEVATITAYLYGRSLLEALEAGAAK
jgi:hypothetical protein